MHFSHLPLNVLCRQENNKVKTQLAQRQRRRKRHLHRGGAPSRRHGTSRRYGSLANARTVVRLDHQGIRAKGAAAIQEWSMRTFQNQKKDQIPGRAQKGVLGQVGRTNPTVQHRLEAARSLQSKLRQRELGKCGGQIHHQCKARTPSKRPQPQGLAAIGRWR